MHLDEEQVQRLLHGEIEPAGERLARDHLATCEECRVLLDKARAEEHRIFGLLREVDHPAPDVDPRAILTAERSPGAHWERWAAGILLVAAAGGVAYAAPGSPLPAALDRLVAILAPAQSPTSTDTAVPDTAATDTAPRGAGIALKPGERLTIRFEVQGDSAFATLSLVDGEEAVVRAVAGGATFSSDVDRLSVRSMGPARFEILIPRSAPWVEVLAGDTPIFRKRAADVVARTEPSADGRYGFSLSSPAPLPSSAR